MIETNFDSCVGPLHCVCRTKILFVQWPLLKYVTRELKVCRGATQLEQFNNYFPRPFSHECCLMIILFIRDRMRNNIV